MMAYRLNHSFRLSSHSDYRLSSHKYSPDAIQKDRTTSKRTVPARTPTRESGEEWGECGDDCYTAENDGEANGDKTAERCDTKNRKPTCEAGGDGGTDEETPTEQTTEENDDGDGRASAGDEYRDKCGSDVADDRPRAVLDDVLRASGISERIAGEDGGESDKEWGSV